MTISAHKLYGPKGVGAVFQRRGLSLPSLVRGGHQEKERRPGTENTAGIVGFGVAAAAAQVELSSVMSRIGALRDRLEAAALAIPGARRFGAREPRVANTFNVGFEGVEGELVLINLDLAGVSVSTGAACTSGSVDPSPVILSLGVPRRIALQATRFSLGTANTAEEIDAVAAMLPVIVARVRSVDAVAG